MGQKLTERWATAVTLPGLLFVGIAVVGRWLGQFDSIDRDRVVQQLEDIAESSHGSPEAALIAAVIILTASSTIGVIVGMLGAGVEDCWTAAGPVTYTRFFVEGRIGRWQPMRGRAGRWDTAHAAYSEALPKSEESDEEFRRRRASLASTRNRIGMTRPRRATWIGDRLRETGQRVEAQYSLDLSAAWPRLWLLVPGEVREEVRAVRRALLAASTMAAWGLLYVALGLATWWPVAIGGWGVLLIGWRRARVAADGFASLVESVVDLHVNELAERLSLEEVGGSFSSSVGQKVTERLRKGS